ncbi:hypothetical protein Ddc_06975 [Ditylenchus destructor]|nr:hypothetical protein Ddc_06975 [Ditylenchus destructor]
MRWPNPLRILPLAHKLSTLPIQKLLFQAKEESFGKPVGGIRLPRGWGTCALRSPFLKRKPNMCAWATTTPKLLRGQRDGPNAPPLAHNSIFGGHCAAFFGSLQPTDEGIVSVEECFALAHRRPIFILGAKTAAKRSGAASRQEVLRKTPRVSTTSVNIFGVLAVAGCLGSGLGRVFAHSHITSFGPFGLAEVLRGNAPLATTNSIPADDAIGASLAKGPSRGIDLFTFHITLIRLSIISWHTDISSNSDQKRTRSQLSLLRLLPSRFLSTITDEVGNKYIWKAAQVEKGTVGAWPLPRPGLQSRNRTPAHPGEEEQRSRAPFFGRRRKVRLLRDPTFIQQPVKATAVLQ